VLDADGRVLAVIDGQPVALVWISGPGTLDLIPGDFAPIGYSSAASLVTKLTPNIRSRVESLLVTPDGSDLVLILTSPSGPIEVRFGSAIGDNAQIEKLVRLERKLADIGDDPVSVIDVSTAEVTVR
jgi:cell division protein FtsQ